MELKDWPHLAQFPNIKDTDSNMACSIELYTDGSESDDGVGSGFNLP